VIIASHAIIYAEDPEAARTFVRDVLELPLVDAGGGWLIFKLPPAELGIHPTGQGGGGPEGPPSGHHEIYLLCDDIVGTVAELETKGADFAGDIEDEGFGRVIRLRVPGAGEIGLYQPKHPTAYDLEA
jgi:catechol 2,3-dioxygenase-like lactoylglutathione lyase family enzyme